MSRLNLTDLTVESFVATVDEDEQSPATYSLDHATACGCSDGPRCTLPCVAPSQATDIQICCG